MEKAEYTKQDFIDEELEHMQVNSSECESSVGLIVSDICRLYCLHRGTPEFGPLIEQQMDDAILKEATYRGESRHEEREGL